MENTVYLIMEHYDYEGSSVVSVHRSEDKAIQAAEEYALRQGGFQKCKDQNAWRKWGITISVEPFELKD